MSWLIPILSLLLGSSPVSEPCVPACRCLMQDDAIGGPRRPGPTTIEEEAQRWDDVIFVGRVVGRSYPEGAGAPAVAYEFEVEETFLIPGDSTRRTLTVRSAISPYACGVSFDDGERALVYAAAVDAAAGVYATSTCQRTASLSRMEEGAAEAVVARLRRLARR